MTLSAADQIVSIIEQADAYEAAVLADRQYSDDGRANLIGAAWRKTRAMAADLASADLQAAQAAIDEAQAAFNTAYGQFEAVGDYSRQAVASMEAQALGQTARDFETVAQRVAQAVATRDIAALRSLARVGLPLLQQRAAAGDAGLADSRGTLEVLAGEVDDALLELEPDNVKKARQRVDAAQQQAAQLHQALDRIQFRWTTKRGGTFFPQPLFVVSDHASAAGPRTHSRQRWP